MDEWECKSCAHDNEWNGSFGDDEICEKCGVIHETDWDYSNYDSVVKWIVGIRKDQKIKEIKEAK